jgi:hypothetical protein
MRLTRPALAAVAVSALLCPACGPKKPQAVKVRGKVFDSTPRDLSFNPQTGRLEVNFYKAGDDGSAGEEAVSARVEPDGRFEAELEPGKYRVGVAHYAVIDFSPDKEKKETYKGKFAGPKSPIVRDVDGPTDDLDIDLARAGR